MVFSSVATTQGINTEWLAESTQSSTARQFLRRSKNITVVQLYTPISNYDNDLVSLRTPSEKSPRRTSSLSKETGMLRSDLMPVNNNMQEQKDALEWGEINERG